MHKNIMKIHTIYDYHTVSNIRVYCFLNQANTTTVFQTKLFSTYCEHMGNFLQKSLNNPITQSEVITRTW